MYRVITLNLFASILISSRDVCMPEPLWECTSLNTTRALCWMAQQILQYNNTLIQMQTEPFLPLWIWVILRLTSTSRIINLTGFEERIPTASRVSFSKENLEDATVVSNTETSIALVDSKLIQASKLWKIPYQCWSDPLPYLLSGHKVYVPDYIKMLSANVSTEACIMLKYIRYM